MLFPYCTGCDVKLEETNGNWDIVIDPETGLPEIVERDYWDYWSGKLLIFESTDGDPDPESDNDNKPHIIRGTNYIAAQKEGETEWIFDDVIDSPGKAALMGNATFSMMSVEDYLSIRDNIFTYNDEPYVETFLPAEKDYEFNLTFYETLVPTESFLVANYHKPVKLITRNGRVVTNDSADQGNGNQGTTTGGNMPTIGGGHDMFITGIDGGINVAVASPQMVYVANPTGTVLFSGYVQNRVDIPLPITGIYIVKGETEVQKIFY
jgi:hypothetical protein